MASPKFVHSLQQRSTRWEKVVPVAIVEEKPTKEKFPAINQLATDIYVYINLNRECSIMQDKCTWARVYMCACVSLGKKKAKDGRVYWCRIGIQCSKPTLGCRHVQK